MSTKVRRFSRPLQRGLTSLCSIMTPISLITCLGWTNDSLALIQHPSTVLPRSRLGTDYLICDHHHHGRRRRQSFWAIISSASSLCSNKLVATDKEIATERTIQFTLSISIFLFFEIHALNNKNERWRRRRQNGINSGDPCQLKFIYMKRNANCWSWFPMYGHASVKMNRLQASPSHGIFRKDFNKFACSTRECQ